MVPFSVGCLVGVSVDAAPAPSERFLDAYPPNVRLHLYHGEEDRTMLASTRLGCSTSSKR
jgi:hypothetical protein